MKNIFFLITIICSSLLQAQNIELNLVPNFSFEQHDSCPYLQDQIEFATGWSKYSKAATTPDYFNACANPGFFGVPKTGSGYRTAHRNCNAFAALATFATPLNNYREYIGIRLNKPLIIGYKYFLSFYTAWSPCHISLYYFGMPSNNIGIKLSTVSYSENHPAPIDNFSHLHSEVIVSDTNWRLISGNIIADSAYKYIFLGNFYSDKMTDTLHINCNLCRNDNSYYYVDDICLSTDSSLCNSGINFLPCNTIINKNILGNEFNIYPNPVSDILNITTKKNLETIVKIYDFLGNSIHQETIFNRSNIIINFSKFPTGYYFLKIINKNSNTIINKKVFKF